jgi:hypothetical protein
MTTQPEARLQRRIRKALEEYFFGSFWFKVHGGPYQSAGIPDLLGCVDGRFCALEVKVPGGKGATRLQLATIDKIRKAGGIAGVVTSSQEAIDLVQRSME